VRKADLFLLLKSRHQNRKTRTNRVMSLLTPAAKIVLVVLSLLMLGALFFAGWTYAKIAVDLPSIAVLPVMLNPADGELLQPTRLTDRSGSVTLTTLANPGVDRAYLSVNPDDALHFSPQLVRAVVARFDPTFWENLGYNLKELQNPQPQTIAERLASDLLLWDEPLSANRAMRMRILAAQLVKEYGRTKVLEWYLNSAYFGHLAYGAESASQLYFEKSAQDLSLAESALLAVLLETPALNPIDAPGAILEAQRLFLADMAQTGLITTDDFTAAVHQELSFRKSIADPESSAPSFTRLAKQQLDQAMGQRRLERGGLVVKTTLDLDLQDAYYCAALAQLMVFENPSGSGVAYEISDCNAALLLPTQVFTGLDGQGLIAAGLVADPQTGQVLAYLSPVDYSGIVRTEAFYQSGTLISPFIALAGFTGGFSPSSFKWDIPVADGSQPSIVNPDGVYHGPVSLRSSIVNDYLTPLALLTGQMDVSRVNTITSALDLPLPESITSDDLFSAKVTFNFLQLGTAYSALANSGMLVGASTPGNKIELNLTLQVVSTTNRLVLDRSTPAMSPVLSEQLAYLINDVLSDNATRRDQYGFPNPFETGQVAAVKIGQTTDKSQVWTVGYTPDRLVITWMGIKTPGSVKLQPEVPAGLWNAMMKTAALGLGNRGWQKPAGITEVEVCIPSGMLPTFDCPQTRKEVFLSGNEPVAPDTLFEKIQVNRESGQRATVFTAPELIEEKVVMNVPASMRQWAIDNGYEVAPAGYDSIPYLAQNPDAQLVSPALFSTVGGKVTITGTAGGTDFGYYSLQFGKGINPASWQQLGGETTTPVENGPLAEWDTTGLNGLYALRLLVVTSANEITQAVSQVTLDNIPPLITLTTPSADQELQSVNNKVTLSANVSDSASISKVEWWIDGKLSGTQAGAPFAFQVSYSKGKHTVQLKAWDSAGNLAQSPTIEFSMLP
jgi:membrane peptidoglycan carboxypeptidase